MVAFFPDEVEDARVYDDALLVELGLALWLRLDTSHRPDPEAIGKTTGDALTPGLAHVQATRTR